MPTLSSGCGINSLNFNSRRRNAGAGGSRRVATVVMSQSEIHRLVLDAHKGDPSLVDVLDPDALTLYYRTDSDALATAKVTNENKLSQWAAIMSNVLAIRTPGKQHHVALLSKSGTDLDDLLDDSDAARLFSLDKAIFDAMVEGSRKAQPDSAMMCWEAADSGALARNIGSAWWRFLTGTELFDGSDVAVGASIGGVDYDHFANELWDTDKVPFKFAMNRFDVLTGGNTGTADWARFRDVRVALDRLATNERNLARSVPFTRGLDPILLDNGPSDINHPNADNDGLAQMARLVALNIAGQVPPPLDRMRWREGALHLSSSHGAITTMRQIRGGTLPVGQPEVANLFIRSREAPQTLIEATNARLAENAMDVGVNVAWAAAGGNLDMSPFINIFKVAWPWEVSGGAMSFDSDEYPSTLTGTASTRALRFSASLSGIAPYSGRFRLMGRGAGQIRGHFGVLFGAVDVSTLPLTSRNGLDYWYIDFDYDPAVGGRNIEILTTSPGNNLRDMALVHHDNLDRFAKGEIFQPSFVSDLRRGGFRTLRFLDWVEANAFDHPAGDYLTASNPGQRYVSPSNFTYNCSAGTTGLANNHEATVPIEHIVALANEVGANPWINLPVDMTVAKAREWATYIAANLATGLVPHFEYGNEVWNSAAGFESYQHAVAKARAKWGTSINYLEAAAEWVAYRAPQLYSAIKAKLPDAEYIFASWAFSQPIFPNGSEQTLSYTRLLVDAKRGRAEADAGPALTEICTRYAIGMYFAGSCNGGSVDEAVALHIAGLGLSAYEQAQLYARYVDFGWEESRVIEVETGHIGKAANATWADAPFIGVGRLIKSDVVAGLDPLTGLETVLRLVGQDLQYKGVGAADWTTVLSFTDTPGKTLAEMIADVDLLGWAYRLTGTDYTGLFGGLRITRITRIEGHSRYCRETLGMELVAYEGGHGLYKPHDSVREMFREYSDSDASAGNYARLLTLMQDGGFTLFNHYMSHNRYADADQDFWGLKNYIGSPETPIFGVVADWEQPGSIVIPAAGSKGSGFAAGDMVEFATGGAGASDVDDIANNSWLDFPCIVDATGALEAVNLQPWSAALRSDMQTSYDPGKNYLAEGIDLSTVGGTEQGDGWWYRLAGGMTLDSASGHIDLTSMPAGAGAITCVVDVDIIEGNAGKAAALRARDLSSSGSYGFQAISLDELWGEVSVSGTPPHGWLPLSNGATRVWFHVSRGEAGGRLQLQLNHSIVGGAYRPIGIYAGSLTSVQVSQLA